MSKMDDTDEIATSFTRIGGDPLSEVASALVASATVWGDTVNEKCERAFVLGMAYEGGMSYKAFKEITEGKRGI